MEPTLRSRTMTEREARAAVTRRPLFGDTDQLAALDKLNRCCKDAGDVCYDMVDARCEVCRMHLCEEHVWVLGERILCERHAEAAYETGDW